MEMEHISQTSSNSNSVLVKRRNKNNKRVHTLQQNPDTNDSIEWKSDTQQQIYSSKLLRALRQVRLNNNNNSNPSAAPKRVREAADRVLAATAKGRSRWSRAILTNKIKLSFMKKHNIVKRQRNVMTVITTGSGASSSSSRRKSKVSVMRLKSKGLPAVQRKGRVLGRLVPGCRKQPLPIVLDEATDYIAALEMQIRAMSALAEMLSGAGSSSPGGSTLNQPGSSETTPRP